MIKSILIIGGLFFAVQANAQSQTLKGVYLPSKTSTGIYLPDSNKKFVETPAYANSIVYVGDTKKAAQGSNASTPFRNFIKVVTTDPPKNKPAKIAVSNTTSNNTNDFPSLTGGNSTDNFTPLTGNNSTGNFPSLTSGYNQNKVNSTSKTAELPPLVDYASSTTANLKNNIDNARAKTVAELPSLLSPVNSVPVKQQAVVNRFLETVDTTRFIRNQALESIIPNIPSTNIKREPQKLAMPELAPLENVIKNSNTGLKVSSSPVVTSESKFSGMPELAPIEGVKKASGGFVAATNQDNKTNGMPELAPIEKEKTSSGMPALNSLDESTNQNPTKSSTLPKGILVPNNGKSVILMPTGLSGKKVVQQNNAEQVFERQSIGGGMGLPALAPIQQEEKKNEIPELAPIEASSTTTQTTQNYYQQEQQYQQVAPPQPKVTRNKATWVTDKKIIQQQPCPPCPPQYKQAVTPPQQRVWKPKAKKVYWRPKTKTYSSTTTTSTSTSSVTPKGTIVNNYYYYNQQPSNQQQKTESQQQPASSSSVTQKNDRTVYTDYTNSYTQKAKAVNNNGYPYNYDPKKYTGVSAGPTSGDFPMNNDPKTPVTDIKYGMYLNPKGKHSIVFYGTGFKMMVTQDGKLINDNSQNGQMIGVPGKRNFFGAPESVSGVPIQYNYNRTIHKVGNIELCYDFDGMVHCVGPSEVLYNGRTSVTQFGPYKVYYGQGGYVQSVDPNDGLLNMSSEVGNGAQK